MIGYLVAFGGRPKTPETFIQTVVDLAKADGVDVTGAVLTTGPGCYNLAIALDEPNDRFAEALAMALMPAKFCITTDPRLKVGEYVTDL